MTDLRPTSRLKIPIAIALGFLFLILFASLGVVGQSPGSWSQYANDSQHTGHNPNVEDVRQKPEVKWSHGGWVVDEPPVLSNGRIYYPYRGTPSLIARNATTGERIWSRDTVSPASSPAVADGKVYTTVYTGTSKLYALDASTGNTVWSTNNHTGTPTVYNNKLYLTNPLAALNASTGNTLWTRNISGGTISVVNQTVYAVNGTEYIHVIDASTGRTVKRHQLEDESATFSQVIAHGNTLYLTERRRISDPDSPLSQTVTKIYALDRANGRKKWSHTPEDFSRVLGAVTPEMVYIKGESSVYALDTHSGSRLWSYNTSGRVFGGIAVGNRTLYMNVGHMRGGEVHAMDAMTGEKLWKIGQPADEGDNILASSPTPVPGDGIVYAGGVKTSEDGARNFYVLSENGTPLSELNSESGPDGSAATSAIIGWVLIFVLLGAAMYVGYRRI